MVSATDLFALFWKEKYSTVTFHILKLSKYCEIAGFTFSGDNG